VPNPTLVTQAWILSKRPPAETFETVTCFSAEHGTLTLLSRVVRKAATTQPNFDLFDEVSLHLESRNQGRTWFVQESNLLVRHRDIGRSYETLRYASLFASLIARNEVTEDTRGTVYDLARTAFASFASNACPDIVYFKSLYCFARDEGYPLKQQWFPTLPCELREHASHWLRTPLSQLPNHADAFPLLVTLQQHLEDYLRAHTDILLG